MTFQDLEACWRKDLADDISRPDHAVAAGIFQINTSLSTFKCFVNALGTPKDTPELREKLHKTRQHIGHLAKDTSAKLKATIEADHATEVRASKKIGDAKLAKDFQAVLKEFQKAQQTAAERETAYAPFVPQAVLPSIYTASELKLTAADIANEEQRALLVEQRRQEVLLLENEVVFNDAVIEERDQEIREIQQQIGELNESIKVLARLVNEQHTMIDGIDSNIESARTATVQANRQLSKTAKSQKSKSCLACLLIAILGVVLLIVIAILATGVVLLH